MRIRLIPATGQAVVLGDDMVGDYIADYAGDLPAKPEELHFFGADYPLILDNGFKANVRTWKVDRAHKDAATAFLFAEQHAGAVPRTGTLEITDDSGAVVYMVTTRNVIRLRERKGVNTIFEYGFYGQGILTAAPK